MNENLNSKKKNRKFPRIDLHCHLDGSLTRGCLEELLGRPVKLEELQAAPDCKNLAEYLEKFDLPLECLQNASGLRRAGYDFIEHVAADCMDYVEVRFAPLLSCGQGMKTAQVIESVLEGLEKGKKDFGVEYGVIVCAMRHHSQEQNLGMLKDAAEFLEHGVCAADLAGNEAAFPMSQFMELFDEVKKMGMPFTLHAGECGDAQNIVDSINCGAGRIGHGIAMEGHPEVIKLCKEKRIGIEMCPVSNLQTRAVQSIVEYPIREFLDAGLLVTLNTDNRTVSGTFLDKEIALVQESCGVTDEEISGIMKNAVEVAFASDEVKDRLLRWR